MRETWPLFLPTAFIRVMEWFGFQRTFKGHLVQLHCNEQGDLQQDQRPQSPIQPNLECFQAWGIYNLSQQPVPVFHHPPHKNFFLSLNLNTFSLKSLPLVPFLQALGCFWCLLQLKKVGLGLE